MHFSNEATWGGPPLHLTVLPSVTGNRYCNRVLHQITTKLAPSFQMMYLQILCRTALLALPTASFRPQLSKLWCIFPTGWGGPIVAECYRDDTFSGMT